MSLLQAGCLIRCETMIGDDKTGTGQPLGFLTPSSVDSAALCCAENLRRIGLAAYIYANHNNGFFPGCLADMRRVLERPSVLICPSSGRKPPLDWRDFTEEMASYRFLHWGLNIEDTQDVAKIFAGCPIHGFVCHGDGSVQTCERFRKMLLSLLEDPGR